MRRRLSRAPRYTQRGWAGLVALLLALLIVAWLAKSALTSYGITAKPATADSTAPPTDPRQRARAVEEVVIEKSRETTRQIDEQLKNQ